MGDYDKVFVITPELRDAMLKELKKRRTGRVIRTLEQLDPCYPTGRFR